MQPGIFDLTHYEGNAFPYWPYVRTATQRKVEHASSGTYVAPRAGWVVTCLHGAGGGGGSYALVGEEAGGGGGGALLIRKFKVMAGWRFVYSVGAKGNGGNPSGANGGSSTLSVYDQYGNLVATQTVTGGTGAPGTGPTPGTGGTYSETTNIATDQILLKAANGNAGDAGATFGNDVGGYGGDTLVRSFDPFDKRLRGIGSLVNNGATTAAEAIGSGGGGGVGSGIGSNGKDGCFWAVFVPE